ncbi:hypothetical protein [Bacillus pumilus]|nr:hypothetical protein [Bacillus pumilus]
MDGENVGGVRSIGGYGKDEFIGGVVDFVEEEDGDDVGDGY